MEVWLLTSNLIEHLIVSSDVDRPGAVASVRFRRRHILLRFCYLGWDYQGLASQEDTARTIEAELFRCLQLTRLVRDRQTAHYHRCGRTDKVSRPPSQS